MPLSKDYEVETEVTVRVRDVRNNRQVLSTTVVDVEKANSYDPDRMITPIANKCLTVAVGKIWDHTLLAEKHEFDKGCCRKCNNVINCVQVCMDENCSCHTH